MSKELEADLKEYFNTLTKEQLVERMYKTEIAMKQNVKTTIECATELQQALTPPTEKELCGLLSVYLKAIITTRKNKHGVTFNYAETKKTIISKNYNLINIQVQLPPHLITLIGRFYEKESEAHK